MYSLGVVMYEMVTGVVPYNGDSLGEIAVMHMNAAPTPICELNPAIPEVLATIIMHAMDPKKESRYQTAAELADDLEQLSRERTETIVEDEEEAAVEETPDVMPVRSVRDLSRSKYLRRRKRASRVSFLSGVFLVLAMALGIFVFLWNYWIKDIFSPVERIPLPNFVGASLESLENDPYLMDRYRFEVTYVVDSSLQPGLVISQDPLPERSVMVVPSGIEVSLIVSTGSSQATVPDLSNRYYAEALQILESLGLNGEIENATSSVVTRDYVISCSPVAGETLSIGSTVYVTVSSGPEIQYVDVPNLIGLTEDVARSKLENSRLSYGGSEYVASSLEAGTVVGQSEDAFTQLEEHAKIKLYISNGAGE